MKTNRALIAIAVTAVAVLGSAVSYASEQETLSLYKVGAFDYFNKIALAGVLYLLVLLAYLPGLIVIARLKYIGTLPLLVYCFLGLFIFNALGSILVLLKEPTQTGVSLVSWEYIVMLVAQALIFYLIAGPYIYWRVKQNQAILPEPTDAVFVYVLGILVVVILGLYLKMVGHFLLVDLLSGKLNADNALLYRLEATYGLPNFKYYRLGFFVLPAILAAHTLLLCLVKRQFDTFKIVTIILCFVPPLLLAEKSGVLHFAVILFIAYSLYRSSTAFEFIKMVNTKVVSAVALAFIPTIMLYWTYYGKHHLILYRGNYRDAVGQIVYDLVYRIFGVYSEALAAVTPIVNRYGEFSGQTLPTIHGLLSHERLDLEGFMHKFLYDNSVQPINLLDFIGGTVASAGSASVPALGEGYINFGWNGFVLFAIMSFASVVAMQEALLRLKLGLMSYSLMVWYAYLSMTISMTGIFATIISFIHTYVLMFVILVYVSALFVRKIAELRSVKES